ncbi:MAG: DUF1189 family protein [Legionellaceae bacterium]|nr:DUF1189 family protein [Legionellaceae bacterium]
MLKRKNKLSPVDRRIYRYWQALYLSLYSPKLYVDVAKRWKGFGIFYCMLLLSVAIIPFAIKSIVQFNQYSYTDFIEPISKIPKLHVLNGHVVFEGKQPYFITNKEGKVLVIVDTTGKITRINDKYPDLIMLITKDAYNFRSPRLPFLKKEVALDERFFSPNQIETYSFKEVKDGIFDTNLWIKDSDLVFVKNGFLTVIYPFLLFSLFGLLSTFLIVFAMMGQVASYTIFKYKLKFKVACRITIVSSTASVCLFLCLKAAALNSFWMNTFCLILISGYFSFAVLSVKRESRYLVHS